MKQKHTTPRKEQPVSSRENSDASSTKENKTESGFFKRLLIFCLIAAILLGCFAGALFYLDENGKLESIRAQFSSTRSGKGKTGDYYLESDEKAKSRKNTSGSTGTNETRETKDYSDTERETLTLPDDGDDGDLCGYTIILDAGHGGRDTGCVFPFNNPQYNECDFNLRIAQRVKEELESRGATVYLLRNDDSWVSLYSRIAQTHLICLDIAESQGILPFSSSRADELRALLQESVDINEDSVASGGMGLMVGSGVGEDLEELFEMEYQLDHVLFLSIHLNSHEARRLHGTQIFYVTDESVIESERHLAKTNADFQRSDFPKREEYYGRHNDDNELLACCLYDNIVGNIPDFSTNATPVCADNYAVLREHGLTGALIEVAYLSDDNDREMLLQDSVVDEVASSVGDGVKMYFLQRGI
ncbi:MAG: N-acetylmuramoyl-L-alanine amidase [Clostridiales bacterium]|nr:N-acetylmuramoyl-L-alanine amidase [Clostridiales bacterium]